MRTIAVSNIKGGSGKTTTVVNLAYCLARRGRAVLVIDVDSQASATRWLSPEAEGPFLEDVLAGSGTTAAEAIRATRHERLDLLPASARLAARARALAGEPGAELFLRQALSSLAGHDYVLLDCPPDLGLLTLNAWLAAGEILVPVPTEPMAVDGLVRVLLTAEQLAARFGRDLPVSAIVPVRVKPHTVVARQILASLRSRFPATAPVVVHETVYATEAPAHHQPIPAYRPGCTAALDYEQLAEHLILQERRAA